MVGAHDISCFCLWLVGHVGLHCWQNSKDKWHWLAQWVYKVEIGDSSQDDAWPRRITVIQMVSRGSTCPVANVPSRSPCQQTIFRHTPSWSRDFGLQMEGIVIAWCICTTWISRNHPMTGTFCLFGFPLPIFRGFPGSIAAMVLFDRRPVEELLRRLAYPHAVDEKSEHSELLHIVWLELNTAWNHIGNIGVTQLGMGFGTLVGVGFSRGICFSFSPVLLFAIPWRLAAKAWSIRFLEKGIMASKLRKIIKFNSISFDNLKFSWSFLGGRGVIFPGPISSNDLADIQVDFNPILLGWSTWTSSGNFWSRSVTLAGALKQPKNSQEDRLVSRINVGPGFCVTLLHQD